MFVNLQHRYVALTCYHLVSTNLSYSILNGELDHQMIGRSHGLPRIEGRPTQYGIVSRQTVDNKECNILSNLLRVIIDRYGQCNCTEGVYFRSSKPDE